MQLSLRRTIAAFGALLLAVNVNCQIIAHGVPQLNAQATVDLLQFGEAKAPVSSRYASRQLRRDRERGRNNPTNKRRGEGRGMMMRRKKPDSTRERRRKPNGRNMGFGMMRGSSSQGTTSTKSEKLSQDSERSAGKKRAKRAGKKGSGEQEMSVQVVVPDFYLGYDVPGLTEDPSEKDVAELVETTRDFWNEYFLDFFAGSDVQFEGVELEVVEDFFIPDDQSGERDLQIGNGYNYRIDFLAILIFSGGGAAPDPQDILIIMADNDLEDYIEDFVRTLAAFASARGVGLRPKEENGQPVVTVDVNFIMSYAIPDLFMKPNADERNDLVDVTGDFFDQYLEEFFMTSALPRNDMIIYEGLELLVEEEFFETNEIYNYQLKFKATVLYDIMTILPLDSATTYSVFESADLDEYILEAQMLTVFASMNDVLLEPGENPGPGSPGEPTAFPTSLPVVEVQVPDFYLAYVVPALDSIPPRDVLFELEFATQQFFDSYLASDENPFSRNYVAGFLKVERDFFGLGIPSDIYNYYVEFEMVVLFDASLPIPSAGQLFDTLSGADYIQYILEYVRPLPGGKFGQTNEVVFRIAESLSTAPSPSSASIAPSLSDILIEVPNFAIAYVVPGLSSIPLDADIESLRLATEQFFDDTFEDLFAIPGLEYTDLELSVLQSFWEYGFPEERFNWVVEFNLGVNFASSSSSPPTGREILEILTTDSDLVSYIVDFVRLIPGTPFVSTSEVIIQDSPMLSPPSSVPSSLVPSFVPSYIPPSSLPSQGTPSFFPSSSAPSETAPSFVPSSGAPSQSDLLIELPDFFASYVVPGLMSDPSGTDRSALVDATQEYLDDTFRPLFEDSDVMYTGLELIFNEALYGLGFPEAKFNYIVDFSMVMYFASSDTSPPSGEELFNIIKTSDLVSYLFNYVRDVPSFATANEVLIDSMIR